MLFLERCGFFGLIQRFSIRAKDLWRVPSMCDQVGICLKIVWSVCGERFWSVGSEEIVVEFGWEWNVFALEDEFVGLVAFGIGQFQGNRRADGAVQPLHIVGEGVAQHVVAVDG